MALTKKQKLVLDFIQAYWSDHGFSPTQVEIQQHFGFRSLGSVQDYIRYLTKDGYLQNDPNAPRGLRLPVTPLIETTFEIPLLGTIAAGLPIEVIETPETLTLPSSLISNTGKHFALSVQGQSMIDEGILDGDTVIIKEQKHAHNGQTVVAIHNQEATLKKYFQKAQHIELHPANPSMQPFIVQPEDAFEIRGILVGLYRHY